MEGGRRLGEGVAVEEVGEVVAVVEVVVGEVVQAVRVQDGGLQGAQFHKCNMFDSYLVSSKLDHNLQCIGNSSLAGIVCCCMSHSLLKNEFKFNVCL